MEKKVAERFFKQAQVIQNGHLFKIALDDRIVRTPAGTDLYLPNLKLANAVALEWQAQKIKISPSTMPLMQLACTVIDHVIPNRDQIISQTLFYADADLLCYRSDAPLDLESLQEEIWQPILDWADDVLSAPLVSVKGITHVEQPANSLSVLCTHLEKSHDWELAGISKMTQVMGSLVLALAVLHNHVDWEEAFQVSILEEKYQMERWGETPEAIDIRNAKLEEVRQAAKFVELLRSE